MVQQSIASNNRRFMDAFNRGDIGAVAALYTEDARLLPPNSEVIKGREGIRAFWQAVKDMGVEEAALETMELQESGDRAVEIGAYRLQIRPPGGQAITDKGKYVVV